MKYAFMPHILRLITQEHSPLRIRPPVITRVGGQKSIGEAIKRVLNAVLRAGLTNSNFGGVA
jgi:hypothetical protein